MMHAETIETVLEYKPNVLQSKPNDSKNDGDNI